MSWSVGANRLARDLAGRGVEHGDLVTVALPNSIDWFVAYVACWKLGAVPQPVSAKLPARELADIVGLAGAKVVLGAEPGALEGADCLPAGYAAPTDLDDGPLPMRHLRRGRRRRRAGRPAGRS